MGYAFVDDTDLVTAGKENETYKDVVKAMQGAADEFEGGVRATGGALEPSKTYWYLMDYMWNLQCEIKMEKGCN